MVKNKFMLNFDHLFICIFIYLLNIYIFIHFHTGFNVAGIVNTVLFSKHSNDVLFSLFCISLNKNESSWPFQNI